MHLGLFTLPKLDESGEVFGSELLNESGEVFGSELLKFPKVAVPRGRYGFSSVPLSNPTLTPAPAPTQFPASAEIKEKDKTAKNPDPNESKKNSILSDTNAAQGKLANPNFGNVESPKKRKRSTKKAASTPLVKTLLTSKLASKKKPRVEPSASSATKEIPAVGAKEIPAVEAKANNKVEAPSSPPTPPRFIPDPVSPSGKDFFASQLAALTQQAQQAALSFLHRQNLGLCLQIERKKLERWEQLLMDVYAVINDAEEWIIQFGFCQQAKAILDQAEGPIQKLSSCQMLSPLEKHIIDTFQLTKCHLLLELAAIGVNHIKNEMDLIDRNQVYKKKLEPLLRQRIVNLLSAFKDVESLLNKINNKSSPIYCKRQKKLESFKELIKPAIKEIPNLTASLDLPSASEGGAGAPTYKF